MALGHAELMERAANDTVLAEDARVVAGELRRLGRMASRILLLASAGAPTSCTARRSPPNRSWATRSNAGATCPGNGGSGRSPR